MEKFLRNIEALKQNKLNLYNQVQHYLENNEFSDGDLLDFQKSTSIEEPGLIGSKIVFQFGLGQGDELRYILEEVAPKSQTKLIIIFEYHMLTFLRCLYHIDLSDVFANERIIFVVAELLDIIPIHELFEKYHLQYELKCNRYSYHIPNYRIYEKIYLEQQSKIEKAIKYTYQKYGNDEDDSYTGIVNMFKNIDYIMSSPGVNAFENKYRGCPAIVASAGPSLDKNVKQLIPVRDEVLIFCPDTSLKILKKNGLLPDYVASLERVDSTPKYLSGLTDEEYKEVTLIACPVIPKRAMEVFTGRKLIAYRDFSHFSWLEIERGQYDIKYSSGNMAFKIAQVMGCNPIILIGQDLAFGDDGNTHADGSVSGKRQDYYHKVDTILVKGNYKDQIPTTESWNKFRLGYEQDVKDSNVRVINATEGGAWIKGTEVRTLLEALESVNLKRIKDYRKNLEDMIFEKQYDTDVSSMKEKIKIKCNKAKSELEEIKKLTINERYLKGNMDQVISRLLEAKRYIFELGAFNDLMLHIVQSKLLVFENKINYETSYNRDMTNLKRIFIQEYLDFYRYLNHHADKLMNIL